MLLERLETRRQRSRRFPARLKRLLVVMAGPPEVDRKANMGPFTVTDCTNGAAEEGVAEGGRELTKDAEARAAEGDAEALGEEDELGDEVALGDEDALEDTLEEGVLV